MTTSNQPHNQPHSEPHSEPHSQPERQPAESPAAGKWQPIETAPEAVEVEVIYTVLASAECKRNGGRDIIDATTRAIRYRSIWCGVLGGKPHGWRPIAGGAG